MWVAGCEECRRLWQTYAADTNEDVRLGNKLQLAVLKHEIDAIALLTPQLELAGKKRQSSREVIRGHETHHGHARTAGQGPSTK
jgi:hypothetical protein